MLLGAREVSKTRASSKSKRFGMSLHAPRRRGIPTWRGASSHARLLSDQAGLSDVQRLRDVAVQEARTGFAEQGLNSLEACHAFGAAPALRNYHSDRRSCPGSSATASG